jgi:hypothetical protein
MLGGKEDLAAAHLQGFPYANGRASATLHSLVANLHGKLEIAVFRVFGL